MTVVEIDVSVDESQPIREYVGLIWIEEKPGIRLRILARSLEEARSLVSEEYGDGHVISIWSEGDAASPRSGKRST
ncbi:hypothetical protein MRQ36_02415 [Micromonospora sp. R77]|uniref:hypothetical protein n=1 Tax=Micromonospora sp. R77 TaxID=2925836 RepID=UPI001F615BC7|nr:hypothetical protein [Micromonospora sp. R77]MCI4061490.1 hypothetical protein [Micromonospora sp. R77]